jgi:hypothetical protein
MHFTLSKIYGSFSEANLFFEEDDVFDTFESEK